MKYVGPGTCAYCKQTQRHANLACPYNLTAHAQYVRDRYTIPAEDDNTDLVPFMAGVVAAEVIAGSDDQDIPAPAVDPGGTFEGFDGGDSGGGGASDTF